MAFDVSTLPAYVEQNTPLIIKRAIIDSRTISLVKIQPGVRGSAALNLIDTSTTFQDGSNCDNTPAGTTPLTQRLLVSGRIKVYEEYCIEDLIGKWTETQVRAGANVNEAMPFEAIFLGEKADDIAGNIETAVWQGDTASGNANLNKFDGFIKILKTAGGAVVTGSTGGAITTSNVIATLNSVYAKIPPALYGKSDLRIFVGYDVYVAYTQALVTANLFHFTPDASWEYALPGTTLKVTAVHGLDGTNSIIAAQTSRMVVGVDLESDSTNIKLWYSQDDDKMKLRVRFVLATQFANPAEVVYFH